MRTRTFTLAALAAISLLAACGSDDEGAADTTTTSTAAETTAPDTTAAETTTPETTTEATTAGSVNPEFAEYCAQIQDYKDQTNAMDSIFNSSDIPAVDQVKTAMETVDQMMQSLEDNAPAEIKADVATVNAATSELIDFFAANDYDLSKIATDQDLIAQFQDIVDNTDASDAGDNLDTWALENCGIEPDA